jgi:hypothetical protein
MTRSELEDERSFLLRSLADLDREHEAGDLSEEDYAVLRDGYVARTAEVLRSLDGATPSAGGSSDGVRPGPRVRRAGARPAERGRRRPGRRRRILVTAGVVAVAGCAVWAVVTEAGIRLPGESATGSVTLTGSQQTERTLAQAETLENEGDVVDALKLYQSVLQRAPTEEEALAEVGWLEYEAGAQGAKGKVLALGESEEQRAEAVDPGAFAPHLYLGSMLLAQGDPDGAVVQYRQFLADHPPRATVTEAVSFITEAFTQAHEPVPALPVGGSSTAG